MAIMVTLAHTGPVPTVVYRCGLALPVLAGLAMAERRRRGPRPLVRRGLATAAGFFLAVDLVLFNHAIVDLGAGIATTAGNLAAVFVAALAWALLFGLAFGGLRLAISRPSLGWLLLLALLVQTAGALVLAAVILGQRPTPLQLAGAVLVCSGVLVVVRTQGE